MFETDNKHKYGILISGGLDSAILLCMLAKTNPSIKIQPFTINKSDGALRYVQPIIDYVNSNYGTNLPKTIVVGNQNLPHNEQGPSAVKEIKQQHDIDYLFFGSNKNPPVDIEGLNPVRIKSNDPAILCPFFDMYKTDIVNLAIEHDLQYLFEITHSCTELQETRCNVCWQCRERAWAFNTLNITDTGTL